MKIIKDKQIVDDNWTHVSDNDTITPGDITLSLARWKKEKSALNKHAGKIGIRLSPADPIEDTADDLSSISLIALEFPAFTDGRSFSQARILRNRYHYKNEIRALGDFMPDQVFYLSRVGVNAFQLKDPAQLDAALATMTDFTVQYQASTC